MGKHSENRWSEVGKVIKILTILEENGVDINSIAEKENIKLGEIDGIEELIRKNNWERDFCIGRATATILKSAQSYITGHELKKTTKKYPITRKQLIQLRSIRITN